MIVVVVFGGCGVYSPCGSTVICQLVVYLYCCVIVCISPGSMLARGQLANLFLCYFQICCIVVLNV